MQEGGLVKEVATGIRVFLLMLASNLVIAPNMSRTRRLVWAPLGIIHVGCHRHPEG